MPLKGTYPKHGHVLYCDFTRGFVEPEMVKRRPVVVVSPSSTHGRRLCTVAPISSTPPNDPKSYHCLLTEPPIDGRPAGEEAWVKCDMLYTVSFERLDKPHRRTRAGREYYMPRITGDDWNKILEAVREYLKLT